MDNSTVVFLIPVFAMILDYYFGDPSWFPHPVRYLGMALDRYDKWVRSLTLSPKIMGGVGVVGFSLVIFSVLKIFLAIPFVGVIIALYLAYAGLALGGLLSECRKGATLLDQGNIEAARKAISQLVSRDVSNLDEAGLRKALAETTSENLNDGFVAPFFYLVVTGPAGMWVYKTVSTMDSMWGYKNEQYKEFGYYAAKADDILAFIPARITAFMMLAAGRFLKLDWERTYENLIEDAGKSESPNAGWPMAAAAWLLGAQMGGKAVYFGEEKEKPVMGPVGEWTSLKLKKLGTLMLFSGILSAILLDTYFLLVWLSEM
ncbi:adenosylcobinamide-phosphate synthase CbiB [Maridesulfovibrio ferrireducens]|uniref:adenosylcobinamide-phosphate synthase CbiB n=1 Tax=Maridesulfovibrio ferrireducens TaxID=246191 RepID=UPI001A2BD50D|nr:adenosylcobinamide-phosphate synthase CbiB [Maridesulfovibrio ferrireducens]MBI9110431.1 cobalamin biosynthesis protein CobD [Maridesulfovibrio ferrireducens]